MSTSRTAGEDRGDLFGARFELFADVLAVGLAVWAASLPLVTFPAALATACTLLRRRLLFAEPCTAGRYFAALRTRVARRGEWTAGACVLGFAALVAADAGLATAGLPGAVPFALVLAVVAGAAAVVGLRAAASPEAEHDVTGGLSGGLPGSWRAAVRAGAGRTAADLPGSGMVVLALCTAAVCAWALPPVLLLLPGPLALALTAVELRRELRS